MEHKHLFMKLFGFWSEKEAQEANNMFSMKTFRFPHEFDFWEKFMLSSERSKLGCENIFISQVFFQHYYSEIALDRVCLKKIIIELFFSEKPLKIFVNFFKIVVWFLEYFSIDQQNFF